MNDWMEVTPYYEDLLPKVKNHYWEVKVRDEDRKGVSLKPQRYTLHVALRRKRKYTFSGSIYIDVSLTDTKDHVRYRVKHKVADLMQILEITPPPTKHCFLSHTYYGHINAKWVTDVERFTYPRRTDWEYKYDILTVDFEDLEHEFKKLLSKATTAKGLPSFVTGMK